MTPQRILFGLLTPGLGGHTRTAVALADVLRSRGHLIEFLVGASADQAGTPAITTALIRAGGFPVIPIAGVYARPGQPSFRHNLRELVRRNAYDALHWFEMHAGIRDAALVAGAGRRAFVWTVTSGGVPPGYYGLNRVVVYTQEVAHDVRRRSPGTTVHVLPARIDLRALTRPFVDHARTSIRHRLAIADDELLIVRVARCSGVYLRSVRAGIALATEMTRAGCPARFLHAGYVEERDVASEIRHAVDQANASAGRTIAFSITDDVDIGTMFAAAADVCIGSGRSAIEAVALQRPTLVAWGSRYLGMVDAENIGPIAETNFQGRNSEKVLTDEDVVSRMRDAVLNRLKAPDIATHTHEACARFIRERYSVESAAEAYERLYEDRSVTVDGFLKYYSSPRHLGRELFHRLPLSIRASRAVNILRRAQLWPGLPGTD